MTNEEKQINEVLHIIPSLAGRIKEESQAQRAVVNEAHKRLKKGQISSVINKINELI